MNTGSVWQGREREREREKEREKERTNERKKERKKERYLFSNLHQKHYKENSQTLARAKGI